MKILVIEDDVSLLGPLQEALSSQGLDVDLETNGTAGYEKARLEAYDILVLDIGLPGMDGLEILRRLREDGSRVPVLLLTSKDTLDDIVHGLDLGADDYLPKPFRMPELAARLSALHRRARAGSSSELSTGSFSLDLANSQVRIGGQSVRVTRTELLLLRALMTAEGKPVSRETLLTKVWGIDFDPGTNVVEACVARIRKKLKGAGGESIIQTVTGQGYRCE